MRTYTLVCSRRNAGRGCGRSLRAAAQTPDPGRRSLRRAHCAMPQIRLESRPSNKPRKHKARRMRLAGKISIITGAGRGIGHATALKFAREGAKVIVCDLDQQTVEAAVKDVRAAGGEAHGFVVDVTAPASIQK